MVSLRYISLIPPFYSSVTTTAGRGMEKISERWMDSKEQSPVAPVLGILTMRK